MVRSLRASIALGALLLALSLGVSPVAAAPAITITPASGPPETEFAADLRGFTPGETVALRLTTTEATPRSLTIPAITIDAEGSYHLIIPAFGLPPGDYTLAALRGTEIVATARLTVLGAPSATPARPLPSNSPVPTATRPLPTATLPAPTPPPTGSGGNLPGLPNTGDGGSIGVETFWFVPIVVLALALGALRLRRVRGHRVAPDAE